MNIFYLDPNPIIAASMHCDQHLNKMILESAQMLSTAAHTWYPKHAQHFYEPAYEKHPCTIWVRNKANALWVTTLAEELNEIRLSLSNCDDHASIHIIREIHSYIESYDGELTHNEWLKPIFCGSALFKEPFLANTKTVSERYQAYYLYKAKRWALDGKARMSYKGRSVPDFLKDCEYVSQ